ncbi:MAG: CoA-binding protein [Nitrososphaerales archaeon]|nr:CoA-binding protein [Nitrososphaerales archaeon]
MVSSTVSPQEVVRKYRYVAVVGASKSPEKEAYTVPQYLQKQGFRIVPVNPTADAIHGEKAYPSLAALPDEVAKRVEVVDVFRPSEELPQVASQVVEMKRRTGRPFVFWAQQGIENEEAKRILGEGRVDYVMDACMRTMHQLYGR